MILVARLRFRACQRFPVRAVDRFDSEKVRRANLCDRSLNDGGAANPLAKVLRDLRRQLRVWFLAHHWKNLLNAVVGNEPQERRLLQLYGKPLPQRAIENGVRGCVGEIGEDNGVLVSEFRSPVEIKVATSGES